MPQIEGRNPVIEALKGRRKIDKIFLKNDIKGENISQIISQANQQDIPVQRVKKRELKDRAKSHSHQGVIALAQPIELFSVEDILDVAQKKEEPPFIVILDHIQDPHNFGAIIRTAYAAGAHGVIFPKDRAADISPVVVKASAGAIEHMMMVKVANINYTIEKLKQKRVWIAGAEIKEADVYYQRNLQGPIGIVIGNEGTGLKRLVKENCDFLIKIPMKGKLGSLNASVASGILFYEIFRQRSEK